MENSIPWTTADEAVSVIQSGQRVHIHSVSMAPQELIAAMCRRHTELNDVEVIHVHTEGRAPYTEPEYAGAFRHNACFVGGNVRKAVNNGLADYIPVFLSDMPGLFRSGLLPIDVAMITVSPPDRHGYCNLGSSVDINLGALASAKIIIAEINDQSPQVRGEGYIHISRITHAVEVSRPMYEMPVHELSDVEIQIGKNIAELVEDGAALQMGIGAIPDAVLSQLGNHKALGIHTEMFSDGIIPLVEKGIITGEHKKVLPNAIVGTFALGSQRLYDFIDNNPSVMLKDAAFTNDPHLIRKNPKATAINSAIEIDLTGQVCADSIGRYQYSGVGGQMDFIRGASLSEGGKPIIAMPSTTRKGESKLVEHLKLGAAVTTTRAHVHWVVTEYGAANLFGMNLRQRAKALIGLAHPDHREALDRAAFERFKGL